MIVNEQKEIEFQSSAEVLFNREELKKAILWYSSRPVTRLKCVFLYGKYYAVSIYDQKVHIHRLLVMYWLQRDLEPNEYVHHKDGDKFNNHRENLELMTASVHQSITNRGRKFSDQHRKKLGEANKKRKGMKYKQNLRTSRATAIRNLKFGL